MAFHVKDEDIARYYQDGYIVFRQILPLALIHELRLQCDKAVLIARRRQGPQAQRLQPVQKFESELDLKPFNDFRELSQLHDAIAATLTPEHYYGRPDIMGVLFEPERHPWCTHWHRDMTLETSGLPTEEFQALMLDWNACIQVNCPLYDDD